MGDSAKAWALEGSAGSWLGGGIPSMRIDITGEPYYCDPTGTNDSWPGLFSAIMDAAGSPVKKTVYAPKGTYKLAPVGAAGIGLPFPSGVRLVGEGMFGGTVFKLVGQDIRFISWGAAESGATSANPTQNIEFRDFEVDGSAVTAPGAGTSAAKGFHMQHVKNARFTNLNVHDCGMTGLGIDHCYESVVFDRCLAKNNGRLNDGTESSGNGIGIGSHGADTDTEPVTVVNCHAIGNKRYGIFVECQGGPLSSVFSSGARIENNFVSGSQIGIGDCGNRRSLIVGNTVTTCSVAGIAAALGTFSTPNAGYEGLIANNICFLNTGDGIQFNNMRANAPAGRWNVHGNVCAFNTGHGIAVWLDANDQIAFAILDNILHDNSKSGIRVFYNGATNTAGFKWSQIAGNVVYNNGASATAGDRDGIRIDVPATDVDVVNNRCFDRLGSKQQGFGFVLTAAMVGGSFTGNDVRNNLTGGASVTGSFSATTATRGNAGYITTPAPASITVTASPFTYTAGLTPEVVAIIGGTVSDVKVAGVTIAAATGVVIPVEAGDAVVVTYSVAPTMNARR